MRFKRVYKCWNISCGRYAGIGYAHVLEAGVKECPWCRKDWIEAGRHVPVWMTWLSGAVPYGLLGFLILGLPGLVTGIFLGGAAIVVKCDELLH